MKPTARQCVIPLACVLASTSSTLAQSLFQTPAPAVNPAPHGPAPKAATPTQGAPAASVMQSSPAVANVAAAPTLADVSLFYVVPGKPKSWQKHDKVEIIINQTSVAKFEQSLDTNKSYDLKAELSQFPSLKSLFADLTLGNGIGGDTPKLGVTSSNAYKGDGIYERKDRFTARISGLVLDVKPNGLLVLEATETSMSDDETKRMVLSGIVDPKDITQAGSVQSSQMANLIIRVEHSGSIKDASEKGLIPRFFETVFDF